MITVATRDADLKAEVKKHLKIVAALMEETQDVVLLHALRDYRKKIEEKK